MKSADRDNAGLAEILAHTWPLVAVAVIVLVSALAGDSGRLALRYDRTAVIPGELWRLASAHFVHLGWNHTLLNLAGLALVALLFPREYRAGQWWFLILASAAGTSAGFVILRPDLDWYVGLSGVLHGLFAAGALRWMVRREPEGFVLGLFLAAKLAWEQVNGALPMSVSSSGGPVIVDAHLYGAVCGLLPALLLQHDWRKKRG